MSTSLTLRLPFRSAIAAKVAVSVKQANASRRRTKRNTTAMPSTSTPQASKRKTTSLPVPVSARKPTAAATITLPQLVCSACWAVPCCVMYAAVYTFSFIIVTMQISILALSTAIIFQADLVDTLTNLWFILGCIGIMFRPGILKAIFYLMATIMAVLVLLVAHLNKGYSYTTVNMPMLFLTLPTLPRGLWQTT
jgi:hypothetical protein